MPKITSQQILEYGTLGLLAYMPFSLFLGRWLSLYTGGLGQWDSAKDIVTLLLLLVALWAAWKKRLFKNNTVLLLFCFGAVYGAIHLLFIAFSETLDFRSSWVGTLYNGRVIAYGFIGLVAILASQNRERFINIAIKTMLVASTLTCIIALVQYLAPKDLMTHFGYSIERGAKPSFFIDDKPDFPRVMSTIRDPNSYGAYLIIPLTYIWLRLLKNRKRWILFSALLALHGVALFLTFSRGAWIGAFITLVSATIVSYAALLKKAITKFALPLIVATVVLAGLVFIFRNHYIVQNIILHSDQKTIMADPNEQRIAVQKSTLPIIFKEPQGHGPGTAGIASIGNPNGELIPENYYLQVGYEVGLLGLAAFVYLLVLFYRSLVLSERSDLRVVLLTSFWGYAFIALLIHLWSNEAVAAQWWLLAGLVMGVKTKNLKSDKIN